MIHSSCNCFSDCLYFYIYNWNVFFVQVTIKDHSGSRYMFNCGEWLLKRGNDDRLMTSLSLTEQNIDQLSSFKGKNVEYMKLDEEEHLDAVEESIHENLTSVLEGIIASDKNAESEEQFVDIPVTGNFFQFNLFIKILAFRF